MGIVLLALAIFTNIQAGFWPSFVLYLTAVVFIFVKCSNCKYTSRVLAIVYIVPYRRSIACRTFFIWPHATYSGVY